MDNDVKLYVSMNYRDEKSTGDAMRNALTSIAKEIQRFRLESGAEKQTIYKNDHDVKIPLKKNNKNAKLNEQVKKLKKHLKTVCSVAKIVLSAKNRETEFLANHLHDIRNESFQLTKSNAENLSLIQQLRKENYNINNEVQFLCNFIHMAYKKLQKMRNELPTEMPFIEELKTILLSCGQYYADYCNTREHCVQLERRNRFLKNKLKIVENNLTAMTEELQNLRSLNKKLGTKCEMNLKHHGAFCKKIESRAISEVTLNFHTVSTDENIGDRYNKPIPKDINYDQNVKISNKDICLTSHLETVRNLLLDQDDMLKELEELCLEVRSPES